MLADVVLILHTVFISVVVLAVPLIIVGAWRNWQWVRNPWLRLIHVAMIVFVACEAVIGVDCPLTVWENKLRSSTVYGKEGFIAYWLHKAFFYDCPAWVFTSAYVVGYAMLIGILFCLIPIRRIESK